MDLGLKGKKALVSGGAVGIGEAIVKDLANEGARVVITSRDESRLKKVLNEIGGEAAGHYGIISNITDEGAPGKLAQEIQSNFGNLDIVVNNVGSTLDVSDPYCSLSDWKKVYRLNLEVAIELNNLFIPHMKKQDWGRIVNISSTASMENNGPVPFCAVKAALTAYTRSMGRILAIETKNVVMSAVLPGIVITRGGHWEKVLKERPEHAEQYIKERCPLGRFGQPAEISMMVALLCSKLASFCQGSIVPVDAGQSRHYYNVNGL